MWSERGLGRSSLTYIDGHFLCLSEDGTLRLLRVTPQKYVQVAKTDVPISPNGSPALKAPAWAAPIVSNGLLYLRGADRIVCLRICN